MPLTINSDPKVFVVGAHLPAGGGNMAYHLGCIIHRFWGYMPINVMVNAEDKQHAVWDYPVHFNSIPLDQLIQTATKDDILIANPSFSNYLLGPQFPGKKLMYVQGCNTFTVLDGFFDKYVAVSPFVQKYMSDIYNLQMPVIPAFIHSEDFEPTSPPWQGRPQRSVVTMLKYDGKRLLGHFERLVKKAYPELQYSMKVIPSGTAHQDVLKEMSRNRYFLWLSQIEGFGIPPLEAMMCGCSVVGFHAGGGLSYFKHTHNASVFAYPNIADVIDAFHMLLTEPQTAARLAKNAEIAGTPFTYDRFLNNWLAELTPFIGTPNVNSYEQP